MDYWEWRLPCGAARFSGNVELFKDFKENTKPAGLPENILLLKCELTLAKEC